MCLCIDPKAGHSHQLMTLELLNTGDASTVTNAVPALLWTLNTKHNGADDLRSALTAMAQVGTGGLPNRTCICSSQPATTSHTFHMHILGITWPRAHTTHLQILDSFITHLYNLHIVNVVLHTINQAFADIRHACSDVHLTLACDPAVTYKRTVTFPNTCLHVEAWAMLLSKSTGMYLCMMASDGRRQNKARRGGCSPWQADKFQGVQPLLLLVAMCWCTPTYTKHESNWDRDSLHSSTLAGISN